MNTEDLDSLTSQTGILIILIVVNAIKALAIVFSLSTVSPQSNYEMPIPVKIMHILIVLS